MSQEVEFNSLSTKDDVKIKFDQGSNDPRKPSDKEVAQYGKLRMALVIFFGIVIIAMIVAAVIIIIVSPKCTKAKGELNKSWLNNGVVYQVYPRSFKDSNGDGNGDLKGVKEKLEHLKNLGVKIVLLNSIFASSGNGQGTSNYTQVNPIYGTMEDFENLLKAAHEKDIKLLLDFIPNHTSDKHPWFIESRKSLNNPKRSWYVWQDGKTGGKPPNNWASVNDGTAWEKDNATKQYYLHQFNKDQPDLNLTNPDVKKALKDVLKFWLDKGVDGLRANAVQYMLEDSKFSDEATTAGPNVTEQKYDLLDHKQTFDLDDNVAIVDEWKKFMDDTYTDSYRALIAGVRGNYTRTNRYYNSTDFPSNAKLITDVNAGSVAEDVKKTVIGYLDSLPKDILPNWVLGTSDDARVGDRLGKDLVNAMNVLLLTLPGCASTYYGEEIGMTANPSTTPMQWSNAVSAGFSKSNNTWSAVGADYKDINMKTESEASGVSTYKVYKQLVALRAETGMKSLVLIVVQADDQVFAYTRGDNKYLVVINFSNTEWNGDLDKLSGRGKVVLDTKDAENKKSIDVNKIKLAGRQALVLEMTKTH